MNRNISAIVVRSMVIIFIIGAFAFACLTGCTHHVTVEITGKMVLDDIYNDYQVQPKDLASMATCGTPPSVHIINTENRTGEIEAFKLGAHSFLVSPREIMEHSVTYLKTGYAKSGITGDDTAEKRIEMKLVNLEMLPGTWQVGSKVRIEVNAPGIRFSRIYEGSEYGQYLYTTFADSIHLITRQIIDEPALQNYILCR